MRDKKINYSKCYLCSLSEEENVLIRKRVLTGNKSCKEIARQYKKFGVTENDVYEHVYYHDSSDSNAMVGIGYIYDKVVKIVTRIESYFNMFVVGEKLDPTNVKMMAIVSQELRKSIELLIKLEEKTGSNKTESDLMGLKIKYEKLKNILVEEVSDEDSDRIYKILLREKLIE